MGTIAALPPFSTPEDRRFARLLGLSITVREILIGAPIANGSRLPGDFVRYGLSESASAAVNAAAINAALAANSFAFCHDPGTYVVDATLVAQSDQTVRLAQGVIIQAATTMLNTTLFYINEVENFQMSGGVFDGNKSANPAGTIFGVRMLNSHHVKLFGVTSRNFPSDNVTHGAAADGFYIGGFAGANPGCTDIELLFCSGLDNVRQGLSIVRCDGVTVIGGSYSGTTGTNPGGGIDIEANPALGVAKNIRLVGLELADNYSSLIATDGSLNLSVTACQMLRSRGTSLILSGVENATLTGNHIEPEQTVSVPIVDFPNSKNVSFNSNVVKGQGAASSFEGAAFRFAIGSENISITNNTVETCRLQALSLGNSSLAGVPTNINFSNNTLVDCVDPAVAPTSGVISIGGNTGTGAFPVLVTVRNNTIRDTRGTPAAFAVKLTSVPAATSAGYRIDNNRVIGPTTAFDDNVTGVPPLCGVLTWNPASLVDGAGETSPSITVLGAALGDAVEVYPPYSLQGFVYSGYVSAADTVVIRVQNESGSTVDLASGSWRVRVKKIFQL